MDPAARATGRVELSDDHLAALDRHRRVVVNFDAIHGDLSFTERPLAATVERRLSFADDPDTRIDSIWWNWGEGNIAPYPSDILPLYDHPGYRQWVDDGIDVMRVFQEETRARGIEVFFSHRMNGGDNDLYGPVPKIPLKEAHPDWLFHLPWGKNGYWNFALPEVHAHVGRLLREVAEKYDFDGIELDYARGVVLPSGRQWRNRHGLTAFMRSIRAMLQEVARARGRPFLLAARVPENLPGCHFDGLDVETWAREQLVDMFALGCRSLEVDIPAFRRITAGTPIKLYPSLDDHHSSDGYRYPPIEVFRGVFSNWFRQGADGVQTFNFAYTMNANLSHGGGGVLAPAEVHLQAYRELADPETLGQRDKTFVVQRRGGGHGPAVVPNPEDWYTPRYKYANTNMLAQLPVPLTNDGKSDALVTLFVGDDLDAQAARLAGLRLRVLLNDPAAADLPDDQKIETALTRKFGRDRLYNSPPRRGVEEHLQVRLNGALLPPPEVSDGWLVFEPAPDLFALGPNLVGILLSSEAPADPPMTVEKLELDVAYR